MAPATGVVRAALRDPDFRGLVAARFVSAFGTAMAPIAMAFGVLGLAGSPRWMGAVIACRTEAQMLLQLFGSALAHRRSRLHARALGGARGRPAPGGARGARGAAAPGQTPS